MKSLLFATVLISQQISLILCHTDIAHVLNTLDISTDQQLSIKVLPDDVLRNVQSHLSLRDKASMGIAYEQAQRLFEDEELQHYTSKYGFRSLLKAARDRKRTVFLDGILSLIPSSRIPCLVRDAIFDKNERALVYLQQDKGIDISKPLIYAFQESEVNGNEELHKFLETYLREHCSLTEQIIGNILKPVINNYNFASRLNTELNVAATKGDLINVANIAKIGFGDIQKAFMLACENGHLGIMRLLVQYGVDIYKTSIDGQTAFMLAVSNGKTEAVKLLIELGLEIDSKGPREIEAFRNMLISSRRNSELIKLLIEELGFDVNVLDGNGKAAVHLAAQLGDMEALRNLIRFGADLMVKDSYYRTILHFAAEHERIGFIESLYAEHKMLFRSILDLQDALEETAAHKAAANEGTEIMQLLLLAGANINLKNHGGESVLSHAILNDAEPEMVSLLLAHGADPNNVNFALETPLMYSMSLDVAQMLIDNGADVNFKKQRSALESAARRNDVDIVGLLLLRGAVGASEALEVALFHDCNEVADILRDWIANIDDNNESDDDNDW